MTQLKITKKYLLLSFALIYLLQFTAFTKLNNQPSNKLTEQYVCMPCGRDCDNDIYEKPGNCSHCNMPLVLKLTVVFKTIQPSEICNYLKKHPNVVLLDVRTKEEFEGSAKPNFGTLKNAINIPIQELQQKLPAISHLKNKEIIVYCSHSHRSPQASYLLMQNGYTNVTNMAGGMSVMKDNSCVK